MIRDITIGQYYPVKSRIHSLDPRVKIICTLLFLVSLFVQSSFLGYVIATLFLGMVIYMSKVPLKYIVKGLKPIVILLMFTVVMNLFLTRGGETLLHFWIFTITEDVRLSDEIIAGRGAHLAKVAEETYKELLERDPEAIPPVYVIGSEVPIPGGAVGAEDNGVQVTKVEDFKNTVAAFEKAFAR